MGCEGGGGIVSEGRAMEGGGNCAREHTVTVLQSCTFLSQHPANSHCHPSTYSVPLLLCRYPRQPAVMSHTAQLNTITQCTCIEAVELSHLVTPKVCIGPTIHSTHCIVHLRTSYGKQR